jgi:protein-tyrosine-phosphatase
MEPVQVESLLDAVRRAPDRMLHEIRRYAARAVITKPSRRPENILVVCHGNVCRSPFAAVIIGRWLAPQGIVVSSAGFVGPWRKSPAEAIHAAYRRGVNLTTHRSQLVTSQQVQAADLVVTMEPAQAREIRRRFGKPLSQIVVLGDFDPSPDAPRAISDPFGQPAMEYDRVYGRIERCAAVFAATVMRAGGVRDQHEPHPRAG